MIEINTLKNSNQYENLTYSCQGNNRLSWPLNGLPG